MSTRVPIMANDMLYALSTKVVQMLSLYPLVSSADKIFRLDLDPARCLVRPYLDLNCLTL